MAEKLAPFEAVDEDFDQAGPEACWICLGDASEGPLQSFCACPSMQAHAMCLGRWCLQQAGREEEKRCRFCAEPMPDYRTILSGGGQSSVGSTPQQSPSRLPVIKVRYGSTVVVMPLQPGEDGKRIFERDVKKALRLPESHKLKINFECKAPGGPSEKVKLEGLRTYDAAFWCASQTAAERDRHRAISVGGGGSGGNVGGGGGTAFLFSSRALSSGGAAELPPSTVRSFLRTTSAGAIVVPAAAASPPRQPQPPQALPQQPLPRPPRNMACAPLLSSAPDGVRRLSAPGSGGEGVGGGSAWVSLGAAVSPPSPFSGKGVRLVRVSGNPGVLPRVAPPCRPHPASRDGDGSARGDAPPAAPAAATEAAAAARTTPLLDLGHVSSDGDACLMLTSLAPSPQRAAAGSGGLLRRLSGLFA